MQVLGPLGSFTTNSLTVQIVEVCVQEIVFGPYVDVIKKEKKELQQQHDLQRMISLIVATGFEFC